MTPHSGNLKLTGKCLNMNKESVLLKVNTIMLMKLKMIMKRLTMVLRIMNWLTIMEAIVSRLMKRLVIPVRKKLLQIVISNQKIVKRIHKNLKIKPKLLKRLAQRNSLKKSRLKYKQKFKETPI